MVLPGTVAPLSVRVTARSATLLLTGCTSVDVLFDRMGSVTPEGGVTLTVFTRLPAALAAAVPVRVRVTVWFAAKGEVNDYRPVTELYVPVLGVKVGLCSAAGTWSISRMLLTEAVPLFVTWIEKLSAWFGATVVGA